MVVTRFLSPRDFGLMALASVVIGFSQLFIDLGVSNAIIHRQDISHPQLSSLFWFNVIMGSTVFALVVLAAPAICRFYDQPALRPVLYLVSFSFILQSFEQQFYALLKKELHFDAIAKRDIFAKVVGMFVAIVCAMRGWGVYALVWAQLSYALVSVLLLTSAGLKHHRPGLHFRWSDIKPFLHFGLYQTGEGICNYFNSQIDVLVVGRILGVTELGIYNVAKTIAFRPFQMINPVVTQVSFPVMAKAQNDLPRLKAIYLKGLNYLCSVNFPVYVFLIAFADPLVRVLFGAKWGPAAPILEILSLYTMTRSIFNPIGSLMLARGMVRKTFWWNVAMLCLVPVAVFVGARFSLWAVGLALTLLQILLILPAWRWLIYPGCQATLGEYLGALLRPLLVALVAGLALYACSLANLPHPLAKLALGGVAMIGLAGLVNRWLNRPFYGEVSLMVRDAAGKLKIRFN